VAKSDLGTKRICPTTGKKFYDLNKKPVISPYTGEIVRIAPIAPIPPPRTHADAAARARAEATPEPVEEEELVPLEEADAEENTGKVKAVVPELETISRSTKTTMMTMMTIPPSSPTRKKATRTSPTSSATSAMTRRRRLEISKLCSGFLPRAAQAARKV
jgi:uncharacterized protein (TIGR02300 family)